MLLTLPHSLIPAACSKATATSLALCLAERRLGEPAASLSLSRPLSSRRARFVCQVGIPSPAATSSAAAQQDFENALKLRAAAREDAAAAREDAASVREDAAAMRKDREAATGVWMTAVALVAALSIFVTAASLVEINRQNLKATVTEVVDAKLSDMNTRFSKVETDVAQLKTDVAELKTDVAELKTDVAELKTDVAELKTDVAELKTDVAKVLVLLESRS